MSLGDRIPSDKRAFDSFRVQNILWLSGFAFLGFIIALLLLQRLGLPMPLVLIFTVIWAVSSIFVLAWLGRTMTSPEFFFADRLMGSAPVGIGGTTDWISGAFLVLFFTASLAGKMILAPALMLGLLLQATLFSNAFQRTGVSTLPGFFAWRGQTQLAGQIALLAVAAVLLLLTLAEFDVARRLALVIFSGLSIDRATWIILALAVVPSICGGWMALLLVNGTLAIWMLVSVISPALVTGFFPFLLKSSLELDRDGQSLQPLQLTVSPFLGSGEHAVSAPVLLMTLLIVAAGFSVLPHALSRLSLNARPVAAIESLGWSALCAFLVLSTLPLSIGLIGSVPTSAKISMLLESQPVLFMLPYVALLLAAFNALSVTLFAFSSAIVRGLRRYRNLNPGEQSIFSTRLLTILAAIGVAYAPMHLIPDSNQMLISALSLSAAALFLPLLACIWISTIPQVFISLSVLSGGLVFCFALSPFFPSPMPGPVLAGALGACASGVLLVLGRIGSLVRKPKMPDERLKELRSPELRT